MLRRRTSDLSVTPAENPVFSMTQRVRVRPVAAWQEPAAPPAVVAFSGRTGWVMLAEKGRHTGETVYTVGFETADGQAEGAAFYAEELEAC